MTTGLPVPIDKLLESANQLLTLDNRDDCVSRLVVSLDSGKADTILPELDRRATLIDQLGS